MRTTVKTIRATHRTAAFCLLILSAVALHAAGSSCAVAGGETSATDAERQMATLGKDVLSADYRADLDALARLRDAALLASQEPGLGYLAHYWAGFASWRIAMNGASAGMASNDLQRHLKRAAESFGTAIALRDDFADGYAAAASVDGWLASLFMESDSAAGREYWKRSSQLLTRARELAPDNPRVLWVLGGVYLFSPAEHGGSTEKAIEIYHQMLEAADAAGTADSPLPHWGKPEALMSLAFAHLNQAQPDLAAAAEEARAALRLEPEWFYVRNILLPRIEAAQREKRQPETRK